jgi:proline iminopeptidase
VVVLHGGPGVPSTYLRPLERIVAIDESRPLLFWDQLGCGNSDRPDDESVYSIDKYVDDLVQLLEEVLTDGGDFHLYGQSFGGILAFEYLRRERPEYCRSVVLSSTPTNVAQVEDEVDRLIQAIRTSTSTVDGNSRVPDDSELGEAFRKKHQVQTEVPPKPLEEAYAEAGTIFRGTAAIADYNASLEDGEDPVETPALILRGESDFVTLPCIEGWKYLFQEAVVQQLEGCAHHGMLERPEHYGTVLETFWKANEEKQ